MAHKRRRRPSGRGLILGTLAIASAVILLVVTAPSTPPYTRAVIILDTLPNTGPETFATRCRAILEPAGYTVETYTGTEVTVERIKNLKDYPIVVLRMHSSVFNDGVWFYTGEPYSNTEHVLEQLTNELHIGRTSPTSEPTFAIGSTYIRKNLEDDLDGAIIMLMGCDGLRRNDLARSFTDSGASVFVSWDGPVTIEQTDDATIELLRCLVEDGASLEVSIDAAMHVEARVAFNSTLAYYPTGVGGFSLRPD